MEGYSVTEAASVLGVPTERVWELLARGVLSGAPEGETGMRVYLQPRPAPGAPVAEPPRTNGHGEPATAEVEASPFRELLTEFRNLTERYGQALLALGEARGEVASLRSRVDVLEARMDLRLPFGGGIPTPSPAPTPPPAPRRDAPAPTATPPADAPEEPPVAADETPEAEPEAEHDPDHDRSARRRRTRAQFVEDFAEALARAEDPNPAELPGGVEAGTAFAALQSVVAPGTEIEPDDASSDAGLPRELPSAEPMIDTEAATESSDGPQPEIDSPTEADREVQAETIVEPELDQVEAVAGVETESSPPPDEDEHGPVVPADSPEPTPDPEPEVDASAEAKVGDGAPDDAAPDVAVPAVEASPAATPSDEPPAAWDRDRYTAVIEEPDWWTPDAAGWDDPLPQASTAPAAAETAQPPDAETSAEPEAETAAKPEAETAAEPEAETAAEPEAEAAAEPDAETPAAESESAPHVAEKSTAPPSGPDFAASLGLDTPLDAEPTVTEETMLWFGSRPEADRAGHDAADEMEVASTGRRSRAFDDSPKPLPGAAELDDALAALSSTDPTPQPAQAELEPRSPALSAPRSPAPAPPERPRPVELPSPASRAYRRLRRIFPS